MFLHTTHNKEDYNIPRCRLHLLRIVFIPDAVKQWSLLKVEVREAISINSFLKKNLETKVKSSPSFFSFGKRYTNIIHTTLRLYCILNYDCCNRHNLYNPQCSCGKQEDTYHFFFVCKNYSNARNTLFDCLFRLELLNIDINLLLCGDVNLPIQINNRILAAVHNLLKNILVVIL